MKQDTTNDSLRHLGVKIPGRMKAAIGEVQEKNNLVTQSEAVRLILGKGLESLGVVLSDITFKDGENVCQKVNV